MPLLDVTDVILDPMFAQEITIIRRAQTVSDSGVASVTETTITAYGVITATGEKYALESDLERAQDKITVHTTVPLRGPASGYAPDVISYQGNRYTVKRPLDWSLYGAGFYAAECEMLSTQQAIV